MSSVATFAYPLLSSRADVDDPVRQFPGSKCAARGDLPTLRLGRRLIVPTARLLQLLGMSSNAIGNVLPSQSD